MPDSWTIIEDLSTPGQILKEEFLEALGVSQYRLAKAIGVDQARISRIVRGTQAITANASLRFASFFGTTPEFWLRLQETYDLMMARAHGDYAEIEPLVA